MPKGAGFSASPGTAKAAHFGRRGSDVKKKPQTLSAVLDIREAIC